MADGDLRTADGGPASRGRRRLVGETGPALVDGRADRTVVAALVRTDAWLDAVYGPAGEVDALVVGDEVIRSPTTTDGTDADLDLDADATAGSGSGSGSGSGHDHGPVSVRAVPDATALGRVAATLADVVDEHAAANRSTAVVVDGLGSVLDDVTERAVFRFLHVLGGYLETAPGTVDLTVGLDGAGDPATVRTMEPLFDAVVGLDHDPDAAADIDAEPGSGVETDPGV